MSSEMTSIGIRHTNYIKNIIVVRLRNIAPGKRMYILVERFVLINEYKYTFNFEP